MGSIGRHSSNCDQARRCSCLLLGGKSASGERSFKARSRADTRIRNRLSNDGADKSQASLFNLLQSRRAADGALLSKLTSRIESRIVTALVYEGPLLSVLAEGHVADAAGQDNDGDVVGGCPVGGEDVELVALADGAEDGLAGGLGGGADRTHL